MYKSDVTLGLYLHDIKLNKHQKSSYFRRYILLYWSKISSLLDICVLEFSLIQELCLVWWISLIVQVPDKSESKVFKLSFPYKD